METYITYFIIFSLGWWLGSAVGQALQRIAFRDILRDLGVTDQQLRKIHADAVDPEEDSQDSQLEVIDIKIEQHQGVLYAFRADNNQFLGQGTDRDTLISSLQQRMTNVRLVVQEGRELIQNG